MKNLMWSIVLLLTGTACSYKQGSGNIVKQQRPVEAFTKLSVSGDFDVEVTVGGSPSIILMADDNVIDDIHTDVNNGQLKISLDNGLTLRNLNMQAKVTVPALSEVKASASARIKLMNELKYDRTLEIDASSGARITGSLHAPAIVADASSGSSLILSGQTRNLDAGASSGATIDGINLLSEKTNVETSSGASAQVHASVQLDAHASSGGNVTYKGGASANIKKSSGGSVNKQ